MKDSDVEHKFMSIPKAAKMLNEIDKDFTISAYHIRRAVKEKKIRSCHLGDRVYVDVQAVYEYLKGETGPNE